MYGFFIEQTYLVPLLPLAGFVIISLLLKPAACTTAHSIAILPTGASFVLSLGAGYQYFTSAAFHSGESAIEPVTRNWLPLSSGLLPGVQKALVLQLGILLDPISVLLMLVVCFISLLVQVYSVGYMHGDPGYRRFFAFLSLLIIVNRPAQNFFVRKRPARISKRWNSSR